MTATLLTTLLTPSEQRREAGEHHCLGPLPRPGQPLPRSRDCLGRRAEPLVELRRDGLRPNLKVEQTHYCVGDWPVAARRVVTDAVPAVVRHNAPGRNRP